MFDNLNPLFQEAKSSVKKQTLQRPNTNKAQGKNKKAPRKDKGHCVKLPVTFEQQILFKTSLKRFRYHFPEIEIKQTKYNTLLLWYALDHLHIVDWTMDYIGTSEHHMTTKLPEYRYLEIGGINGLSMQKGLSERKAVCIMTISALKYIEKGGYYGEILQQIRTVKE
ncbi:hypothetical protein IIE26_27305 (plasmid) [Cytobacillus oceanisediminis]|uniref:hypothetical protein n=1 Tax=Cytobacillus oceanisediminis TaxID=665099 RepID=UPI001863D412|nr:hypothetical protein [Cytobacillus oceanisediminis]QOK30078.1 hypothetical protein IIE26_27305 [Cytobacillus oceanisediminis]